MRKIFLIVIIFLLPWQYSWAMVASYDVHDAQDTEMHFGHHEHAASENQSDHFDLSSDEDTSQQAANCHVHCGFLHLSFAALSHNLPSFACESIHYSSQYLVNYDSSPSYQPERPNWALLV